MISPCRPFQIMTSGQQTEYYDRAHTARFKNADQMASSRWTWCDPKSVTQHFNSVLTRRKLNWNTICSVSHHRTHKALCKYFLHLNMVVDHVLFSIWQGFGFWVLGPVILKRRTCYLHVPSLRPYSLLFISSTAWNLNWRCCNLS